MRNWKNSSSLEVILPMGMRDIEFRECQARLIGALRGEFLGNWVDCRRYSLESRKSHQIVRMDCMQIQRIATPSLGQTEIRVPIYKEICRRSNLIQRLINIQLFSKSRLHRSSKHHRMALSLFNRNWLQPENTFEWNPFQAILSDTFWRGQKEQEGSYRA